MCTVLCVLVSALLKNVLQIFKRHLSFLKVKLERPLFIFSIYSLFNLSLLERESTEKSRLFLCTQAY